MPMRTKVVGDVLDYPLDFWKWLQLSGGDTISSATATASPSDLVVGDVIATETNVTVWLSGGTVGCSYTVAVPVITTGARTKTFFFEINVIAASATS